MLAGELIIRCIRTTGYSLHHYGNPAKPVPSTPSSPPSKRPTPPPRSLSSLPENSSPNLKMPKRRLNLYRRPHRGTSCRKLPALAAARAVLGNRLQLLLGLIDSLNDADTTNARPQLDILIARLNEAINLVVTPARARHTRSGNAQATPGVTPAQPAP